MSLALSTLLALGLGMGTDPYVRSRTSTTSTQAHCLWWRSPAITFQQSSAGNPSTTGDSEFDAVSRSFQSWEDAAQGCSGIDFTEGPRTSSREIGYQPNSGSNQNVILFRTRRCVDVVPATASCWDDGDCGNTYDCWAYQDATIALTTTTFDANTGRVYDADVEFNAATFEFTTVDAPACVSPVRSQSCVSTDVQNTLTHEIGHLLGLEHTQRAGSTMQPNAGEGETSKRTLDEGTISFTCDVYPAGLAPRDCGSDGALVAVACSNYAAGTEPAGCTGAKDDGGADSGGCQAAPGAVGALGFLGLALRFRRRRR